MSITVVALEKDEDGNLILPLSDELCTEMKWDVGDTLVWNDNGDGSYSITKQEMEWVQVDCTSTFRMRYMVQVPKGKAEWALDTVTCEQAKEFSQTFLGENIFSHQVISEEDALKLCRTDNDYVSKWSDDQLINMFFTKHGEEVNKNE